MIYLNKLDTGLLLGYYSSSLSRRSLTDPSYEEEVPTLSSQANKLTLSAALNGLHRLLLTAGD